MPDWAESYPIKTETELVQLKVYLAEVLNLDLGALLANKAVFEASNKVCYKRTKRQQDDALTPATALFRALAKYCVGAVAAPYRALPEDPAAFRAEVLASTDGPVCLEALVTCLWQRGIPVVHYKYLPEKLSRPDALVVKVGSRPCIVLGGKRVQSAWHLFYAAHEAGHIARNHLGDDDVLVDEALGGAEENEVDQEEQEANHYASTLLCGEGDVQFLPRGAIAGEKLARLSIKLGREQRISPGHLLLRHASENNVWPVVMKLLPDIEGTATAAEIVNRVAAKHLDCSLLAPEGAAIVQRALQL